MPRVVIGFHGTARGVAAAILEGRDDWHRSRNDHDWLGHGIYFWEGDARRALRFLESPRVRGRIADGRVIGAEIALGHCLDLTTQDGIDRIAIAHRLLAALHADAGTPMPRNQGRPPDYGNRRLDCEVVNLALVIAERQGRPFDTVRAAFAEGPPAYPGASFTRLGHIQVSVVAPAAIRQVFDPVARGYRLA